MISQKRPNEIDKNLNTIEITVVHVSMSQHQFFEQIFAFFLRYVDDVQELLRSDCLNIAYKWREITSDPQICLWNALLVA